MKDKKKSVITTVFLLLISQIGFSKERILPDYPSVLGWVSSLNNPYNLCGGYYREEPIQYTPNPLVPNQLNTYDITADKVTYSSNGTSILTGHVVIAKPGEELKADLVYLYRDRLSRKMNLAKAYGHVQIREPGNLLVGDAGQVDFAHNTMQIEKTAYRMEAPSDPSKGIPAPVVVTTKNEATGQEELRRYSLTYWGHADTIEQTQPKHYQLTHSTYSTCPPSNHACAWHLTAKKVHLDREKERGDAWNSVLWIKKIPVFYFPYVSFPLSHQRKSGFLSPTYSHTESSGTIISLPYYWNMAPNYDLLFTPAYLSERGAMFSGLFRYLTQTGSGRLNTSFLPHDSAFSRFKKHAEFDGGYTNQPTGLHNLEKDSDTRYSLMFDNNKEFNSHWSSQINYYGVSDDYYIQDIGHTKNINNSQNQLLQQGQIEYQGAHWQFLGMLQNYQTLHPINQAVVSNQYSRLPEISLSGAYPSVANQFDVGLNASAIDFNQSRVPDQTGSAPITGGRFNLNPIIDYPINRVYGYLDPRVQLEMTQYELLHLNPNVSRAPTNVLPLFDVHGGLFFDRYFNWFGERYRQTLEPEMYYLYVPYHNQNDLPLFDTGIQTFDYNFLFSNNRFTGIDRIGDANQVTLAATSRIVDPASGDQKGSVGIGEIVYFENRRVQACTPGTDCQPGSLDKRSFSPTAMQATYNFDPNISGSAYLTWDQYAEQFSNESVALNYAKGRHLLNANYTLNRSGGIIAGEDNNSNATKLQQLNLSGEWLLNQHWDVLGQWSYSWSGNATTDHANAYLAGLEYDSCCWAIRLIESRTFIGVSENQKNMFNNTVYLEADLKGFGSVGTDDPSKLLTSSITNYHDTFEPEVV